MRTLSGKRVALLEGRQGQELAAMVSRLGGLPICAPAVREMSSGADARPILARLIAGEFRMLIVLTGAGASALFKEAERHGLDEALRERLKTTTIVCRGPKPLTALKRYGISAELATGKPHTTAELIAALASVEIAGLPIALLHYGELNPAFSQSLSARGAIIEDVCLYEWALPDDVRPLRDLVSRVIAGTVDALLFTSQIQFRHLMQLAEEMGQAAALRDRLTEDIVIGAVGPVCASALRDGGVVPDVLPAFPNSASLVNALGDYFDLIMRNERSVEDL